MVSVLVYVEPSAHATDTSANTARSIISIEDDLEPRRLNRLRVFRDCKVSSLVVGGTFIFSSLASRNLTPLLLEEVTALCLDLRHDPWLVRSVGSLEALVRVMVSV
jgi:hypothetical protein